MPRHDCSRRLGACTSCTRVSCKYTGARRVFAEEVPGTWYLYQFQDKAHSMLSALYKFTVNECVQVCVFGPHKVSEGYDTIVHWTQRSNKNAGKYKITVVYPRQCSRLRHGLISQVPGTQSTRFVFYVIHSFWRPSFQGRLIKMVWIYDTNICD